MVKDSVREELRPVVKIIPNVNASYTDTNENTEKKEISSMPAGNNQQIIETSIVKAESIMIKPAGTPLRTEIPPEKIAAAPKPAGVQIQTGEINVRTTAPTLVEFQNKNVTIPEWRLKIQNAVQQRKGNVAVSAATVESAPVPKTRLMTNGANALKAEVVEDTQELKRKALMLGVLQRIEKSRQTYFVEEKIAEPVVQETSAPHKNSSLRLAQKNTEISAAVPTARAIINAPVKPKLVPAMRNESGELDTNKLPPLSAPGRIVVDLDSLPTVSTSKTEVKKEIKKEKIIDEARTIHIDATVEEEIIETEAETEEFDDLAPFTTRFNAGLFDLIIGAFASLLLLSPFMISGGEWFSFKGFLGFAVVCSLVMFVYLTTAVGFYGRSLGMKIFSLELIDIEENDYPTLHQAAVNSAVYLLSLMFGGIGFLTIPFNEEKRAVHDLVSGTIVVKE